jgi:CRISPR/Cas system-associated exonuclease Cas4 (RecB family)
VAISRAKRQLILSRYDQSDKGKKIGESSFIGMIQPSLNPEVHSVVFTPQTSTSTGKGIEKSSMHFSWIEDYRRCPRQFYYKRVMEADGKTLVSPYQRYHASIRETLGALKRGFKPSNLESTQGLNLLEEFFLKIEIDKHPNAKSYKKHARKIIESFCDKVSRFSGDFYTHSLTCQLGNGQVYFYPDLMIVDGDLARIFKVEFKEKPKTKIGYDKIGDAIFLMADAALNELGKSSIQTSILYLPSGEFHDFDASEKLRSARKEKAAKDIDLIQKGYFEASPEPTKCNRCKYIFPCPA